MGHTGAERSTPYRRVSGLIVAADHSPMRWRQMRLPVGGWPILALAAVMGLDSSDQSTIGAAAPDLRAAFDIGQTQIGLLATSSTLVGLLVTLPFGVLADRRQRVGLLRLTVLLWAAASVAIALSPTFPLVVASHAVIGLVTGAGTPLVASLLGDLVVSEKRGRAFSVILVGEIAGSAFGTAVCGEVSALVGWRWAYVVLAVAGVAVAAGLWRLREPTRRRTRPVRLPDGASGQGDQLSFVEAIRALVGIRTNVLLVVASSLGYFFFAGVQTFGVSLFIEAYDVSRPVAPFLVLVVGLSIGVGIVLGGPVGDRMLLRGYRSGRIGAVLVALVGSAAFLFPALSTTRLAVMVPLLVLAGVLLGAANPSIDATRIDVVPARLLGRAESVRTVLRDAADTGAPLMFGVLGTRIGLRHTFLAMAGVLVVGGLLGAGALRTYAGDAVASGNAHIPDPPAPGTASGTMDP